MHLNKVESIFNTLVFDMKRNTTFKSLNQENLLEHRQCVAFHEAGHAAAIYLNNKARSLPPVFFQIIFKDLNATSEQSIMVYQVAQNDCIARVNGGRSMIESHPGSGVALVHKSNDHKDEIMDLVTDHSIAYEVDILNLLIGPLAEAKYIADTDGEPFNHKLVGLDALKNYGGSSDLELANQYLEYFSLCKEQQGKKLDDLFNIAFNFITDRTNWVAITKLANYIFDSNKNIINCEEVVLLLEH